MSDDASVYSYPIVLVCTVLLIECNLSSDLLKLKNILYYGYTKKEKKIPRNSFILMSEIGKSFAFFLFLKK